MKTITDEGVTKRVGDEPLRSANECQQMVEVALHNALMAYGLGQATSVATDLRRM